MFHFTKEDFKRARKPQKKVEKQELPVDELPYMWEIPKTDRKDLLFKKVGPTQYEAICGKNKEDLLASRRKPKITVPEPFSLSENRGNKLRSIFVELLMKDQTRDEEEAFKYKFVPTRVPRSTHQPKFQGMKEKDQIRKEYWKVKSKIKRR